MKRNPSPRLRARASNLQLGGEDRNPSKFTPTPQLLALTSGGLLDIDSAADALVWGRQIEIEASHFLHRRGRHA